MTKLFRPVGTGRGYGEPDPRDKELTYNIIRKALETLVDD